MRIVGDCREVLRDLPAGSVQCCVTSPPYWGLRDYGVTGQMGLERTPEEYVQRLVEVFDLVREVLADDGTLWLILGDCYATGAGKVGSRAGGGAQGDRWSGYRGDHHRSGKHAAGIGPMTQRNRMPIAGLKPKDMVGIPWRVAFALQADGWYLRSDIVWHKPNAMPESVKDRPSKAHEYVFLFAKIQRYFYDHEAIKEPASWQGQDRTVDAQYQAPGQRKHTGLRLRDLARTRSGNKVRNLSTAYGRPDDHRGASIPSEGEMRNKRTVWTVNTKPFAGAHFATFPPELIKPCILAGSRPGDVVLDPFFGAGTTGMVAEQLGRRYIGIELNPEYSTLARERREAKHSEVDIHETRKRVRPRRRQTDALELGAHAGRP